MSDIRHFVSFLILYLRRKIVHLATKFEKIKNTSVDLLMFKRGALQKKVWHGSMVGLSAFGLVTSGVFGGETIVSASFPGASDQDPRLGQTFDRSANDPVLNSLFDTHTNISEKPRSEIINYQVKDGDTLSSIADKFVVSADTIKWANNLDGDIIKPEQMLKILPVSGVMHTVQSGDTLESVAKKYSAQPQAILDYPFNDVADDLKLKAGQELVIPDGVPPKAAVPKSRPAPQYLAQGSSSSSPSFSAPGGANFMWPTQGILTQYFSWYHPGDDIANSASPVVVASDGGTVVVAGWPDSYGFGNRVVVDHGNGYKTIYAHLSNIYATVGQQVSRGQVIGQMGSTGRSTGTHLHFELRYKGIAVNPLSILK